MFLLILEFCPTVVLEYISAGTRWSKIKITPLQRLQAYFSSFITELKGAKFSHDFIHFCTLAGAALALPVCWSADHATMSATVSSFPTSHDVLPRAAFIERRTAPFSLLLPSFSWKMAVSTQLSIRVDVTALYFWPNREKRNLAMFPSPSIGHIVWMLNFIWGFGTEIEKKEKYHRVEKLNVMAILWPILFVMPATLLTSLTVFSFLSRNT